MKYATSSNGLALIKQFEGFRAAPTPSSDGAWIVGYGHVRIGDAGANVTKTEAAELLALDLAPMERVVNARVAQPLKQSQFDALVSFALSVGEAAFADSEVLRLVNDGDLIAAACAMEPWRMAEVKGELKVIEALVRRRAAEKALFLKDLPLNAQPSVVMRAQFDHTAPVLWGPAAGAVSPARGAALLPLEPGVRLTQILKSEPATEALLLAQANDCGDRSDGEIVTAHAKPVARPLDDAPEAPQRAYDAKQNKPAPLLATVMTAIGFGRATRSA